MLRIDRELKGRVGIDREGSKGSMNVWILY